MVDNWLYIEHYVSHGFKSCKFKMYTIWFYTEICKKHIIEICIIKNGRHPNSEHPQVQNGRHSNSTQPRFQNRRQLILYDCVNHTIQIFEIQNGHHPTNYTHHELKMATSQLKSRKLKMSVIRILRIKHKWFPQIQNYKNCPLITKTGMHTS